MSHPHLQLKSLFRLKKQVGQQIELQLAQLNSDIQRSESHIKALETERHAVLDAIAEHCQVPSHTLFSSRCYVDTLSQSIEAAKNQLFGLRQEHAKVAQQHRAVQQEVEGLQVLFDEAERMRLKEQKAVMQTHVDEHVLRTWNSNQPKGQRG